MGKWRMDQNIRFILSSAPCFSFVYNVYICQKQSAGGPMACEKTEGKANIQQVCRVSKQDYL